MGFIIEFLQDIAGVISKVIDFFTWFINSLIETIVLAVQALGTCVYYLSQFPVYWLAPFTVIITVLIIFKVKG